MGTLVSDSFTESSDTALASHTPDTDSVGLGWNEETTTTVLAATDDVSCAAADDGGWIDVGTPDQKVSIKFTANADNRMTVNARSGSAHTTGSQPDNGYLFNCRPSPNLMYIYERSSSSNTQLGSSISKTMVASTQFDFKITIEGSSTDNINVYVDSVLEGTRTDATHTTGDYAGFTHNLRNTSAARFDDFLVEDFGGGVTISPPVGSMSATGQAPTVITTGNEVVQPPAGAITASGHVPAINATAHVTAAPPAGAIATTGFVPTVTALSGTTVQPPVGTISAAGLAPTILNPQSASPPVGAISISGFSPSVGNPQSVEPPVGSISASGQVPDISITLNQFIDVPLGSIGVSGYAPSINTTQHQYINVPAGALSLSGYAPAIVGTTQIGFLQATLSISPRINGTITAQPRIDGAIQVEPRLNAKVTIN